MGSAPEEEKWDGKQAGLAGFRWPSPKADRVLGVHMTEIHVRKDVDVESAPYDGQKPLREERWL